MKLTDDIKKELKKLGFSHLENLNIAEIRNIAGIRLFRINCNNEYFILKYFANEEYRREIENYHILKTINVPTIKVFSNTSKSLLLEDLKASSNYRLCTSKDLSDINIIKSIANWYLKLHNQSLKYLKNNKTGLYSELNLITRENIEFVRYKSGTYNNPVWNLILSNFDLILSTIKSLEKTLNHNDFSWRNLAIKKDKSEAIMFDYNCSGISFRFRDIRNICSSLSSDAAKIFLEEYGHYNKKEVPIDFGTHFLVHLISNYNNTEFTFKTEQKALDCIESGKLQKIFETILNLEIFSYN